MTPPSAFAVAPDPRAPKSVFNPDPPSKAGYIHPACPYPGPSLPGVRGVFFADDGCSDHCHRDRRGIYGDRRVGIRVGQLLASMPVTSSSQAPRSSPIKVGFSTVVSTPAANSTGTKRVLSNSKPPRGRPGPPSCQKRLVHPGAPLKNRIFTPTPGGVAHLLFGGLGVTVVLSTLE